jgi:hypothetical protein
VTSTILRTEFLLQFRKQQEDSAILLASNRPRQQRPDKETKKDRKGKEQGKTKNRGRQRTEEDKEQGKTGEDKEQEQEQVGLQEAPHLHDPKQNHSENAKSRNSKQEFFVKHQPSSSL